MQEEPLMALVWNGLESQRGTNSHGTSLWKGIMMQQQFFNEGIHLEVGEGTGVLFWGVIKEYISIFLVGKDILTKRKRLYRSTESASYMGSPWGETMFIPI